MRLEGLATKHHPCLVRQPVLLARIATFARSDDIGPLVSATTTSRQDMVDVLSGGSAILTSIFVPCKDRPSVEGNPRAIGNSNVAPQLDDRRLGKGLSRCVKLVASVMHQISLAREDQQERPSRGDDPQGFEGHVQHESPAHLLPSMCLATGSSEMIPLFPVLPDQSLDFHQSIGYRA